MEDHQGNEAVLGQTIRIPSTTNGPSNALPDDGKSPTSAATSIQSAWKDHKIRRSESDHEENWKIFNGLENKEEADVLQLSSFLEAIQEYMPCTDTATSNPVSSLSTSPTLCISSSSSSKNGSSGPLPNLKPMPTQLSMENIGQIDISGLYEGVHIDPIFSQKNMMDMIESFKRGICLHYKYVTQIIKSAQCLFEASPTIKQVEIAPSPHITVVGDLHGQLDDLLLIFKENGYPSEKNPYVFNGDFVDRGSQSVEVALILYGFYLLYPNHVHINRGNHEEESVSTVFGFLKECQTKYNTRIYKLFIESFRWIPLGTLINKRILVLHGGISKYESSLQEFTCLPRWNYSLNALQQPPQEKTADKLKEQQMFIMSDILWSDPVSFDGVTENSRGAGVLFGPNIAEKFLLKNNLQLIIRSHECVPEGFNWPYGSKGMVVTLFSASNYGGKANNLGAFMKIPENGSPCFYQYMAKKQESDMAISNLESLFSVILQCKDELLNAFLQADPDNRGFVSLIVWGKIMETVLHLPLDWVTLQPFLTTMENNNCIPYRDFLDRYHIANEESEATETVSAIKSRINKRALFDSLYKHRSHLEALFRKFDVDGNGHISMSEFEQGVRLLNQHLPKEKNFFHNVKELMELMNIQKNSTFDINQFLELFRVHARLTRHAKWRRARMKIKVYAAFGRTVKAKQIVVPLEKGASILVPKETTTGLAKENLKEENLKEENLKEENIKEGYNNMEKKNKDEYKDKEKGDTKTKPTGPTKENDEDAENGDQDKKLGTTKKNNLPVSMDEIRIESLVESSS